MTGWEPQGDGWWWLLPVVGERLEEQEQGRQRMNPGTAIQHWIPVVMGQQPEPTMKPSHHVEDWPRHRWRDGGVMQLMLVRQKKNPAVAIRRRQLLGWREGGAIQRQLVVGHSGHWIVVEVLFVLHHIGHLSVVVFYACETWNLCHGASSVCGALCMVPFPGWALVPTHPDQALARPSPSAMAHPSQSQRKTACGEINKGAQEQHGGTKERANVIDHLRKGTLRVFWRELFGLWMTCEFVSCVGLDDCVLTMSECQ